MSRQDEGLKSEPLRAALAAALAGRTAALEDFFARYGGGPDARPNLKLAAAFGVEMSALPAGGPAARLLTYLSAEDAAPDMPPVFLPMAAAHGWVGRLRAGLDEALAWAALAELAADERVPVRVSTHAALHAFALGKRGADDLIAHARAWLELEDREVRFGAAALIVEVFGDRRALATVGARQEALAYFTNVLGEVAASPRSAERSDARRRLLAALPRALANVVATMPDGDRGLLWLEAECEAAKQPDLRQALSATVGRVQEESSIMGQRARKALEGSAKPPRDPTRRRPGVARGRDSRRTR
jgi:hypothetical protein